MTKIYNISPGFLQVCENYLGKKDITPQEVFKRLSLEIGGDGKSITKKQLDNYIAKADAGLINIDKPRLNALKQIQKQWDNISQDGEQITYEDIKSKGFEVLLMATVAGTFTETEVDNDDKESMIESIYKKLMDTLELLNKEDIKKSDLENYLNKVISDTTQDDGSKTEEISVLTNMIASYSNNSTIEKEA